MLRLFTPRLRLGCFLGCRLWCGDLLRGARVAELQDELNRRIDECGERRERYDKSRRHLLEREPDLELVVADLQSPELVLEHDGHFFGVALEQEVGNFHARVPGLERQVEVVRAEQTSFLGLLERLFYDGTHRLIGESFVSDEILGHEGISAGSARLRKWGAFCCPAPP